MPIGTVFESSLPMKAQKRQEGQTVIIFPCQLSREDWLRTVQLKEWTTFVDTSHGGCFHNMSCKDGHVVQKCYL